MYSFSNVFHFDGYTDIFYEFDEENNKFKCGLYQVWPVIKVKFNRIKTIPEKIEDLKKKVVDFYRGGMEIELGNIKTEYFENDKYGYFCSDNFMPLKFDIDGKTLRCYCITKFDDIEYYGDGKSYEENLIEFKKLVCKKHYERFCKLLDTFEMSRSEKIESTLKCICGSMPRCFHWVNHENIYFFYDEKTDSIKSDCNVSINVDLNDDEINFNSIVNIVEDLKDKIIMEFKKNYNIELFEYD